MRAIFCRASSTTLWCDFCHAKQFNAPRVFIVCLVTFACFTLLGAESSGVDDAGHVLQNSPGETSSTFRRKLTGKPWIDMDYGPSLTLSLQVAPGNIAYKGVAIRLDAGPGGVTAGSEFALFDTDTLRYAAAWTGPQFIDYRGIALDGEHEVHPAIVGERVVLNPDSPGWAQPGTDQFDDDRLRGRDGRRFGPLSRDWAHWKGLYLHGDRVVLSYTVGDTEVWEMPGSATSDGDVLLTRTLNLGPRSVDLVVQVAHGTRKALSVHAIDETSENAAGQIVAIGQRPIPMDDRDYDPDEDDEDPNEDDEGGNREDEGKSKYVTLCAVKDAPAEARWIFSPAGDVRLRIPAGDAKLRFTLVHARSSGLDQYASLEAALPKIPPAQDLRQFCQGGPRRWQQEVTTRLAKIGPSTGPYVAEDIATPLENPYRSWMRLGGFDFFNQDQAAVCTWQGDVWTVKGLAGDSRQFTWRRIANGMFQPLGLKIVDGDVYVTCRDQITVLRDLNGDGETDFYDNFNNDAQVTEHFHEFATGLETDNQGNLYYCKCARHARDALVPQHGTLLKVSKDGSRTEIVASGFRAPNGICVNADGSFVLSDQEGHWTPKNRINWVRPGGFYGNMMGYHEGRDNDDFEPPVVWIHNEFDRSPAEQLWVNSSRWGPLENQLLNLSYGTGQIHLVLQEQVEGVHQGGVVHMPIVDFPTGVMRGRFHPWDGQLYVCGLFGWSSDKTLSGGFYRVRHTGEPLHLPIGLQARRNGLFLEFASPLDAESAANWRNYAVQRWNYRRTSDYGSRDYRVGSRRRGRDRVRVERALVSADGRAVFLEIPDMQPVMQMEIRYRLRAADGSNLDQRIQHTIHRIGEVADLGSLGFTAD